MKERKMRPQDKRITGMVTNLAKDAVRSGHGIQKESRIMLRCVVAGRRNDATHSIVRTFGN